MKRRMTIVGGTAWSSHKQNNNEISPENLQVSTFNKKKIIGSIQKVFFLQRRRWVTKTVNKTELPLKSSPHYTRIKTWSKIWQNKNLAMIFNIPLYIIEKLYTGPSSLLLSKYKYIQKSCPKMSHSKSIKSSFI